MTRKLNLLILLTGILIGSLCIPCASAAGTVSNAHPYLLFHDISEVPGYQNQAADPWRTWQSQVLTASDSYLNDNFAGNLGSYNRIYYRAQFAEYLGLAYQITKNTAYAAKAKEALLNMNVGDVEATADYGLALEGYSLAYDWVQPTLDSTSNAKIRDNLATLADNVWGATNTKGTQKDYIDFPDLHGHLYPALGIASAALSDYTNPNKISLSSMPSDWYHAGTDYLFVNDQLHTYGTSLFAHASDPTGKDLLGAYKAYTVDDLSKWFQVCNHAYGINLMSTYPVAEKYFTSETWESMPNEYGNNFVTNGNTLWDYQKGTISLMTPADQSAVLNHMNLAEAASVLPKSTFVNGGPEGGVSTDLLYCVYGNYKTVTPSYPATTSHLDPAGVFQVIRGSWNTDADWLSFTTWNNVADSNRNMIHHDQLGFEYYSRGDLLLADAGEPKHILEANYGEEDIDHNVIAIDNPRAPFTLSSWSGSTSAGIYKGMADQLTTPATIGAMFQLPWMQLVQSNVTITQVASGKWGSSQSLSSPIQYERTVMYPESDYFIIVDRLQGTEAWGYRNIFRPTSLMVTPTTGGSTASTVGHTNLNLNIGSTSYDWQTLAYQTETATGLTANSLTWTTTNPYGKAVTANLVTSPASSVLVEKNDGRIGGYDTASEVFSPVVYFKSAPATAGYRVTALLSSYATETPKTGTELAVTGTGHALTIHGTSYDDYIYSGTGTSGFGTFTTDADTAYIRSSGGVVTDYTMLKGSSLTAAGLPVVTLSKKVDYFSAQKSGSTLSFQISGQTGADITINGVAVGSVTRDGVPYTNWVVQSNGNGVKITTDLSTHLFVVSSGTSLAINPIAPASVIPGTALSFPVNATYTGKGTVTYSAGNLPANATFNSGTRLFSWTPVSGQIGTYTVTFSATDGTLTAKTNTTISVVAANSAPVISAIPAQTITAGTPLSFVVSASDPGGKALTYSASGLPSGATFNTGTHTFSWTPAAGQAGTYSVTFTVSDGTLSAGTTATISVVGSQNQVPVTTTATPTPTGNQNQVPVITPTATPTIVSGQNRAPVITAIVPQTVTPGDQLSLTVRASDPDGNKLTYSASGLPARAVFKPDTHDFLWVPDYNQVGTYTVVFSVSDGALTTTSKVTMTVSAQNQKNHAPVITAIAPQTVRPGDQLSLTIKASDPDGNPLTYSASGLPARAVFNPGTQDFLWVPDYNQAGTYTVTFTASDGSLASSTTVTITVTGAGTQPVTTVTTSPGPSRWRLWHPW